MATWAIGDVHGCFRTLEALIRRLDLDVRRDRLWMVGDLVNRGPNSLEVLRWARAMNDEIGDRFQAVLGNHDLHLIARGLGVAEPRPRDTLEEVLEAPDGPELIEWLRRRSFVHFERIKDTDFVLVHAGLRPGWTPKQAAEAGERLATQLQGPEAAHLLRHRYNATLTTFTSMRMLDSKTRPDGYSGSPEEAPTGLAPWFAVDPRACPGHTVVCGHWAALGLRLWEHLIALDSGCVWSGKLTAVRLDDRRVAQKKVVDRL